MTGPQMMRKLKGICVVGAFDQYAVVVGGKDSNGMLYGTIFFFSVSHFRLTIFLIGSITSFAVKGLAFCKENNLNALIVK